MNKKACPLLGEGKISHRLGHYPIQVACQGSTRYQAQGVLWKDDVEKDFVNKLMV